ncbi:MAG: ABC transporter ATP-binding protein [Defluviitaleaceae bacterium]|nr:ABC transporter ATP-binding protein [Defluviitaleaceae bacterium]
MDVHLKNITMSFQSAGSNVIAVNNFSATIKSGEMVSLLGPSGCGKSTTLMMLAGLYRPTEGQIFFGDTDVTKVDAEKRGIGMVFQNYALYPHMSVYKNIMFPLKMMKVKKPEANKKVEEVARLVQIEHLLDRKPAQLSGGQQQRVAIARALVKEPKLLLLDEPLSNLDARLRLETREEIRRIQLKVGITAVFVTHDQEEAMSISDRIILMKDGLLQQVSPPQEMYRRPVNVFAAEFIGNPPINMLDNLPDYGGKLVGIRAEHFHVSDAGMFQGEVTHMETIGRDTLIRVTGANGVSVRTFADAETRVRLGDAVHLSVKPENIHVFDKTSGERVGEGA